MSGEVQLARHLLEPLHAIMADAEYRENTFALSQAKVALDMVHSMLLLQRLDAKQTELELAPVHVGDSIQKVLASLREYFSELNIDYELDIHHFLPSVSAQPEVLESALKMLLYGIQSLNDENTALQLNVYKADPEHIRITIVSRGVDTHNLVLHNKAKRNNLASPVEVSQTLLAQISGHLRKTSIAGAHGFGVSLPTSKQTALL